MNGDDNQSNEKRCAARRRVLKRARIVFNRGNCSMGCQILNVSDTGALLLPADIILWPHEFERGLTTPLTVERAWHSVNSTKVCLYHGGSASPARVRRTLMAAGSVSPPFLCRVIRQSKARARSGG